MVLSRSGQLKSIWLSRILLAQGTCIPRIFPAYKKPERELPQSKKSGTQVIGMKGQNLVRLAKKRSQLILDCSFQLIILSAREEVVPLRALLRAEQIRQRGL
jgi:hypothetical protein